MVQTIEPNTPRPSHGCGSEQNSLTADSVEKQNTVTYTLTYRDVIAIMEILNAATQLKEVDLEIGGLRLHVLRGQVDGNFKATSNVTAETLVEKENSKGGQELQADPQLTLPPSPPGVSPSPREAMACASGQKTKASEGMAVTAPVVGIFYRCPEPGAPPFVVEEQRVAPSDIVGIIEVMKTMNTVRAGVEGTVTSISVENEQLVEFGQPLLYILPDDLGSSPDE